MESLIHPAWLGSGCHAKDANHSRDPGDVLMDRDIDRGPWNDRLHRLHSAPYRNLDRFFCHRICTLFDRPQRSGRADARGHPARPRGLGLTKEQIQGFIDFQVNTIPSGLAGTPEEIAKAVTFLASDDSSFVNGIELFVDGGMTQI